MRRRTVSHDRENRSALSGLARMFHSPLETVEALKRSASQFLAGAEPDFTRHPLARSAKIIVAVGDEGTHGSRVKRTRRVGGAPNRSHRFGAPPTRHGSRIILSVSSSKTRHPRLLWAGRSASRCHHSNTPSLPKRHERPVGFPLAPLRHSTPNAQRPIRGDRFSNVRAIFAAFNGRWALGVGRWALNAFPIRDEPSSVGVTIRRFNDAPRPPNFRPIPTARSSLSPRYPSNWVNPPAGRQ